MRAKIVISNAFCDRMTDFKNYLKLSLVKMKWLLYLLCFLTGFQTSAQQNPGIIVGNVLDEKMNALEGASISLIQVKDSAKILSAVADSRGAFQIGKIPFGFYRLKVSFTGFNTLTLDSIHFRTERFDFNLNDVILKSSAGVYMEELVIYLEKPLIQNKDGNITFNAGESALSEGSNASELLTNVPLVSKDPNGKIMIRGKEPRILIDDKPVELNLEQLQDLLESMPGSSIEKIEVMTNPPPQYASEEGGVINITTKKGSIGLSGRVSVYAGTREQAGGNLSFNYRKQGLSFNVNTGLAYNQVKGESYSNRENTQSSKHFNHISSYANTNTRPNVRMNMNYDVNKFNSFNIVLQYNQNNFNNHNITTFTNLDASRQIIHLSERDITSQGNNHNPNTSLSYTHKTNKAGETLKLIANVNFSDNSHIRHFYHQYFNPDHSPNGDDSTQQQAYHNTTLGKNFRFNYDRPFTNKKTHVSIGAFHSSSRSDIDADARFYQRSNGSWASLDALTNKFMFRQVIGNIRASVKHMIKEDFSATIGMSAEHTKIGFELYKTYTDTSNQYWSYLPFFNFNRTWKDILNLSFSYRRTIRRPGINEMNPTIDFSDPYNTRFGNPGLLPSMAHNFDLVLGKTNKNFYINLGMGFNLVEQIFSLVRSLQPDGRTEVTWQNISNRKEMELSSWSGYTFSKQFRLNFSASYSYNTYSDYDKEVRKYRNGGSFLSNLNTNYTIKGLYTVTGSFTYNRFANPQGSVRSSLRMNVGLQAKFFNKKMIATFNIIDPFIQQRHQVFTYGPNFFLESSSATQTKNYRLSLAYNLSKTKRKSSIQNQVKGR